jgi:hypothetical protein
MDKFLIERSSNPDQDADDAPDTATSTGAKKAKPVEEQEGRCSTVGIFFSNIKYSRTVFDYRFGIA